MDDDIFGSGDSRPAHAHLADGVRKACIAILSDDTLTAREKADKIKAYLLAHEELADDDDEGDDEPKGEFAESVQRLLRLGKRQRHVAERTRPRPQPLTLKAFTRKLFIG